MLFLGSNNLCYISTVPTISGRTVNGKVGLVQGMYSDMRVGVACQ